MSVCINSRVSSLAAVGKCKLMLFDQHIREDVCLDNQDLLRILRLCSDKFLSKFPSHNLGSGLSSIPDEFKEISLNANSEIKSSFKVLIDKS